MKDRDRHREAGLKASRTKGKVRERAADTKGPDKRRRAALAAA